MRNWQGGRESACGWSLVGCGFLWMDACLCRVYLGFESLLCVVGCLYFLGDGARAHVKEAA